MNEGTVETFPIFRANVLAPITNLDIILDEDYMRVGQPYTVDRTPVEAETVVFDDPLGSLNGWSQAEYVDNGHIEGEIGVDANGSFYPRLVGQVIEEGVWQGPSLKKSIGAELQDFKMEAIVELRNGAAEPGETGMIEIYLLDAVGNIVGKVGIEDYSRTSVETHFKAKAGDALEGVWFGDGRDKHWENFFGAIRLEREGRDWYAYIGLIDKETRIRSWQLGSKRNVHFYDFASEISK